jgi:hypothetical protein
MRVNRLLIGVAAADTAMDEGMQRDIANHDFTAPATDAAAWERPDFDDGGYGAGSSPQQQQREGAGAEPGADDGAGPSARLRARTGGSAAGLDDSADEEGDPDPEEEEDAWARLDPHAGVLPGSALHRPFRKARTFLLLKNPRLVAQKGPLAAAAAAMAEAAGRHAAPGGSGAGDASETGLSAKDARDLMAKATALARKAQTMRALAPVSLLAKRRGGARGAEGAAGTTAALAMAASAMFADAAALHGDSLQGPASPGSSADGAFGVLRGVNAGVAALGAFSMLGNNISAADLVSFVASAGPVLPEVKAVYAKQLAAASKQRLQSFRNTRAARAQNRQAAADMVSADAGASEAAGDEPGHAGYVDYDEGPIMGGIGSPGYGYAQASLETDLPGDVQFARGVDPLRPRDAVGGPRDLTQWLDNAEGADSMDAQTGSASTASEPLPRALFLGGGKNVSDLLGSKAHGAVDENEYAQLVSQHLRRIDAFVRDAGLWVAESALARRVSEWQGKLIPVLEEENLRKEFDIHEYGRSIVDKLMKVKSEEILDAGESKAMKSDSIADAAASPEHKIVSTDALDEPSKLPEPIPFSAVVSSDALFEVCRSFLATLQLANNGNIQILSLQDAFTDATLKSGERQMMDRAASKGADAWAFSQTVPYESESQFDSNLEAGKAERTALETARSAALLRGTSMQATKDSVSTELTGRFDGSFSIRLISDNPISNPNMDPAESWASKSNIFAVIDAVESRPAHVGKRPGSRSRTRGKHSEDALSIDGDDAAHEALQGLHIRSDIDASSGVGNDEEVLPRSPLHKRTRRAISK